MTETKKRGRPAKAKAPEEEPVKAAEKAPEPAPVRNLTREMIASERGAEVAAKMVP